MCPGCMGETLSPGSMDGKQVTRQSTLLRGMGPSRPHVSSSQPASVMGSSKSGLRVGADSWSGCRQCIWAVSTWPSNLSPDMVAHGGGPVWRGTAAYKELPEQKVWPLLKAVSTSSETSGANNFTPKVPKWSISLLCNYREKCTDAIRASVGGLNAQPLPALVHQLQGSPGIVHKQMGGRQGAAVQPLGVHSHCIALITALPFGPAEDTQPAGGPRRSTGCHRPLRRPIHFLRLLPSVVCVNTYCHRKKYCMSISRDMHEVSSGPVLVWEGSLWLCAVLSGCVPRPLAHPEESRSKSWSVSGSPWHPSLTGPL